MIKLTEYKINLSKLPVAFNGFKIAHISDYHNSKKANEVAELLRTALPDIIVITGDLIDSRHTNAQRAISLLEEITKIAPCYYVSGNHEARIPNEYSMLKEQAISSGVTVLENQSIEICKGNESINLIGLVDPRFYYKKDKTKRACEVIKQSLPSLISSELCNIVLCHRPECFLEYVNANASLVLTGHAHGGQIILPLIGGVIAPNQGLFPRYYKGVYEKENTKMLVSRGVGNSLFPFRIFNSPEIPLITLKGE